MARNRMIKPEFCSSKKLAKVSRDARLTFICMLPFCDDYGFILNSARSILGDVYPLDESVSEKLLKKWLDELIQIKVLLEIEHNGKDLLYVRTWEKHQTVPNKSKRVHVEDVDREGLISVALDSTLSHISVELDPSDTKSKEQRVKNKEKGKEKGFSPPCLPDVIDYFLNNGYNEEQATKAFNFYNNAAWVDSKGNKVISWKNKMNSIWMKDEGLIRNVFPDEILQRGNLLFKNDGISVNWPDKESFASSLKNLREFLKELPENHHIEIWVHIESGKIEGTYCANNAVPDSAPDGCTHMADYLFNILKEHYGC